MLRRSPSSPNSKNRHSTITYSTIVILAIATCVQAKFNDLVSPVPQPTPIKRNDYGSAPYPPGIVPPADMDIDELMHALPTIEAFRAFVQKYCEHENCDGVYDFLATYRLSPKDFQKNKWKGPCNNFQEFACEWGTLHGMHMYILALRPPDDMTDPHWHQVAICYANNKYYVFNNSSIDAYDSLEDYINQSGLIKFQIVKWQLTQENPLARFFGQAGPDVEISEMEESDLPGQTIDTNVLIASIEA